MARSNGSSEEYTRPIRRILIGALILFLLALFLFWRIDSPRAERLRAEIIDSTLPKFNWVLVPAAKLAEMVENFQSYQRLYDQNQELRRELQEQKRWREAALRLGDENAKLLALNNVRLDPKLSYVTGVVLADSGSPFRQSVLLNIGARDGIQDGWAATDGLGLVGRISGVGETTSRAVLLTDSSSRIPILIEPSGQRAILSGNNAPLPPIEFLENPETVRPGDRVISSGEGGVFPAGILVGRVVQSTDRRLRVNLAADYERLDFLRVLRPLPREELTDPGGLVQQPGDAETAPDLLVQEGLGDG